MPTLQKGTAGRRFKQAAALGAGAALCCILTLTFAVESEASGGPNRITAMQVFFFVALALGGTALCELYQGYMSAEENQKRIEREQAEEHFRLACRLHREALGPNCDEGSIASGKE